MQRRIEAILAPAVLVLAASAFLGCGGRGTASSASPEQAAGTLADLAIELGSLERAVERTATAVWEATEPPLVLELGRELNDEERDWVRGMLRDTLAAYVNEEIWREAVVRVYVERFTAAEIDQLVEFYDSPAGRKTLSLAAELTQGVDDVMRAQLDARVDELIAEVDTRLASKFEELGGGS